MRHGQEIGTSHVFREARLKRRKTDSQDRKWFGSHSLQAPGHPLMQPAETRKNTPPDPLGAGNGLLHRADSSRKPTPSLNHLQKLKTVPLKYGVCRMFEYIVLLLSSPFMYLVCFPLCVRVRTHKYHRVNQFSLVTSGSWDLNSRRQAWRQLPLPIKLFPQRNLAKEGRKF